MGNLATHPHSAVKSLASEYKLGPWHSWKSAIGNLMPWAMVQELLKLSYSASVGSVVQKEGGVG